MHRFLTLWAGIFLAMCGTLCAVGCTKAPPQQPAAAAGKNVAPAADKNAPQSEVTPESATVNTKFATPAECIQTLQTLKANKKDSALSLDCLSQAARNFTLGNMAFNLERFAYVTEKDKATEACMAVLKKHGLADRDMMGFLQMCDSPVPGGAPLGFMQIGDSIQDPAAFYNEAVAALDLIEKQLGDESDEEKPKEDQPEIGLTDVKIEGDTASGVITVDKEQQPERMYFKRENDSWVLAIGEQEPDWKKPIQGRFKFSDFQAEK